MYLQDITTPSLRIAIRHKATYNHNKTAASPTSSKNSTR